MSKKKIWQKSDLEISQRISNFTVGRDREFDLLLAGYDVMGSIAHTEMLTKAGLLTPSEKEQIHKGLHAILKDIEEGKFRMDPEMEDIHSQIEWMLTKAIGESGKKIHSGRSRNDQVALDIKLYLKAEILQIKSEITTLFDILIRLAEQHQKQLLPGYTHLQVAMPSSFGLWFSAYAESLSDDLEVLSAAWSIVDKNPLGSGAGYGSSFPLNRQQTTDLLGFKTMHFNAINAQMSRGKSEKILSFAISSIASTIAKMSMDICLYLGQNFGFISFPDTLATGSSLMPHKKNPDVFEMIRGKCNRLRALPNEISIMLTNLPSGYHRELQLTKEILFPGLKTLHECLNMLVFTLPQIQINEHILSDHRYKYIFTVEAVNQLVHEGMPFRDAYVHIGKEVEHGNFDFADFSIESHTHEGSMGNLCLPQIVEAFKMVCNKIS